MPSLASLLTQRWGWVRPAAGLLAALTLSTVAAGALSRDWRLNSEPRTAAADTTHGTTAAADPLPLRLVDLGGVGIPPDTAAWGRDYSHNTKAFHRLVLDSVPYVNEAEFARIRSDWTAYVQRMAEYGNNGLVVPLFLELVSFDRIPEIYAGTDLAERHRVVRARFRELFAITREAGLELYLATDMVPLTPPLDRYFERHGHLSANNSVVWSVYRAALEEIFQSLPEVRGVVIRIGEAGSLYNRADWPYRSRFLVGTVAGLTTMLRSLLPAFESAGRSLILRSWSVGVGELGDLHTNPETYARALDGIESPQLIVSTKFQAGDFFRALTVNPTLLSGRHQRLVELQARREFEGFTAFPNFIGPLHAQAIARIRSQNPRVIGTWLWTQSGGPLRAGPMSLYPLHGFWLWIDANAYVTTHLALDPGADPAVLAGKWVRRELTRDPVAVQALTELLLRSSEAIEQGYYIRSFAQQRVTFAGFELPPLLWIMEWDIAGGWSTVWSSIYQVTKTNFDSTIADGFRALAGVEQMQQALQQAGPALAHRPDLLRHMERSLKYEGSLLRTLAGYRAAFFHYYRWLDTGTRDAYRKWRQAGPAFRREAAAHKAAFEHSLDFPAFDFSAGLRSVHLARRATDSRWLARGLLAIVLLCLLLAPLRVRRIALAVWWSALDPWHARTAPLMSRSAPAAAAAVIALATLASAILLSFTSLKAALVVAAVLSTFLLLLQLSLSGFTRQHRSDAILLFALGPVIWLTTGLLAAMSLRGPHHLWFEFWTSDPIRYFAIAILALPIWTAVALTVAVRRRGGFTRAAAIGSVAIAGSAALLVLAFFSPGLDRLLGALDHPLSLAPMTYAVVIGIETYTHLPAITVWYPVVLALLLIIGLVLRVGGGRRVSRGGRAVSP